MTFRSFPPVKMRRHRKRDAVLVLLLCFSISKCTLIREATTPADRPVKEEASRLENVQLRDDVITYARKYLGTKYKESGKTPRQGFDCSGFTSYVMDHFDRELAASSRGQAVQGKAISVEEVQPGDLIFFRRSKKEAVFHVAMVVNRKRNKLEVIHSTSRGVVIDDILASDYWKPKIDSARDVIGAKP